MNLHSFQRLLQLLRCQNEVWASLKWQAACNSNNILKQHLGSKLTDGYPQITKRQGNIQYIHDGSCKWRGKFGANNTLLSTLAWSSFYWFALSLIEAESKSKRKKITQYTMRESDPTTTFETIKGVHFPLAVDTTLMCFFFTWNQAQCVPWILLSAPFFPHNTCDHDKKHILLFFLKSRLVLASIAVVKLFLKSIPFASVPCK